MLFSHFSWKSLIFVHGNKGGGRQSKYTGPALLSRVGGRGRREHPPLSYMHLKCMQISLSPISVLLRQSLSIKKSYVGAVQNVSATLTFSMAFLPSSKHDGGNILKWMLLCFIDCWILQPVDLHENFPALTYHPSRLKCIHLQMGGGNVERLDW